jgi:hypothetical protein
MRRVRLWLGLIAVAAAAGFLAWAWWEVDLRWRPKTLTHDQTRIAGILGQAGWVSPGRDGRPMYVLAYRDCAACEAFEHATFARLQAGGVDTRVIMVARPDVNGLVQSTPAERATVAALWLNRDWSLLQRWLASPAAAWTAPGLPPADGDAARSAVIAAGRETMRDVGVLTGKNGLSPGYPLVVWWSKEGLMRACVCREAPSYRPVEHDLLGS